MSTPEGAVLKQIMDWLAAEHLLSFRMNTGAVQSEHKGKKRFMRFGVPGMADILAFSSRDGECECQEYNRLIREVVWIEVKAPKGKQSELQKSFQAQVEAEGHKYILAYDVSDVEAALK